MNIRNIVYAILVALCCAGCCPVNIVPNDVSCQTACRGAGGRMVASSDMWPYRCECDYSPRYQGGM